MVGRLELKCWLPPPRLSYTMRRLPLLCCRLEGRRPAPGRLYALSASVYNAEENDSPPRALSILLAPALGYLAR